MDILCYDYKMKKVYTIFTSSVEVKLNEIYYDIHLVIMLNYHMLNYVVSSILGVTTFDFVLDLSLQ